MLSVFLIFYYIITSDIDNGCWKNRSFILIRVEIYFLIICIMKNFVCQMKSLKIN